uniref:Betacellulin, epidermal growth factor family member n=1 Tax=Mastacembelus armatus TaxID=205130 RepID=A0A7N8XQZ2_9TELE
SLRPVWKESRCLRQLQSSSSTVCRTQAKTPCWSESPQAATPSENHAPVLLSEALALCKYCLADWNATDWSANRTVSHCHHHSNGDNCTDTIDAGQWNGHFSECPEELKDYCIHGECRYIAEQKAPSCRCEHGFVGSRCEYVGLDWRIGDRGQILIIAGLIFLIVILIIIICICSHRRYRLCQRRGRRREQQTNGTEKHSMIDTSAAHADLTPDLTEPAVTSAV